MAASYAETFPFCQFRERQTATVIEKPLELDPSLAVQAAPRRPENVILHGSRLIL